MHLRISLNIQREPVDMMSGGVQDLCRFYRAAGELGLDVTSFVEYVESGRYCTVVEQYAAAVCSLCVVTTPTSFIGSRAQVGNDYLNGLRLYIESEIGAGS